MVKLLPAKDSLNYVCMVRTYAGPVRESVVSLYTSEWQRMPAQEWLAPIPDYTGFWMENDTVDAKEIARLQHLQDMRFVTAELQPDDMRLTFALQPGEVEREDSIRIAAVVRPLVYEWVGDRFEPVRGE